MIMGHKIMDILIPSTLPELFEQVIIKQAINIW